MHWAQVPTYTTEIQNALGTVSMTCRFLEGDRLVEEGSVD
jgi:hypothetical protein